MSTMTITTPTQSGEVAVFTIKPLVEINEVLEWVELIQSPECVKNGEMLGLWEIV